MDSARAAAITFALVVAVGFVVLPVWGRKGWFFDFEWELVRRATSDLGQSFRPFGAPWNNEIMPSLVWRVLWRFFGLRTYVPYLLVGVAVHLTVAALLRVIMRRSGVEPWISTIVASSFVFFGSGIQNIFLAGQINFTGAVAFGLSHMLLADHDGPLSGRDWLGLAAGLASLMCFGLAVALVAAVGVAVLMRRGLQLALFHTAPLGVAYLAWWLTLARNYAPWKSQPPYTTSLGSIAVFVAKIVAATYSDIGYSRVVGLALGCTTVLGLVLAWRATPWIEFRGRAAVPLSMFFGALVYFIMTAVGRSSGGPLAPSTSHYVYVGAALVLPAIALAADTLVQRARWLAPIVVLLLIIGIPGNIKPLATAAGEPPSLFAANKQMLFSLPRMPLARAVPRSLVVAPNSNYQWVTIGWLLDALDSGRLPDPRPVTAVERATNTLRLSLQEIPGYEDASCPPLHTTVSRRLKKGESITVHTGTVAVTLVLAEGKIESRPVLFGGGGLSWFRDHVLVDVAGPLSIRIAPISSDASMC
jgi:hypothetical protein